MEKPQAHDESTWAFVWNGNRYITVENVNPLGLKDDNGKKSVDKARERKFQSRSEAARYAAQMRWGNRTETESTEFDPATVPMRTVKENNRIFADLYPAESTSQVFGDVAIKAVSTYQLDGSSINRSLRNGNDGDARALGVDRAFQEASPLPTDMVFHRGIAVTQTPSASQQKTMNFFQLLKVGQSFSDEGFSSTSTDIQVGRDFGRRSGIRIEVTARKGAKVLPVNNILRNLSIHKGENEVLLPRKAKFTVWSITDEANTMRMAGGPNFIKVIKVVME